MPHLQALGTALPPHAITQEEARARLEQVYAGRPELLRLLRVLARSGVRQRYFCFPPEYYLAGKSFDERNADFAEQGTALAERAARQCLESAGVAAEAIDLLILVTTTGLATPSLDARLMPRLGFRRDVRRLPLFGLGCAGGVAGLAHAAAHLENRPDQRALVVSVELCGQIFSPRALTPVDVVGTALFAEGAAAALIGGDATPRRGPAIRAARSAFFPGTERIMGWKFTSDGMRLILSEELPDLIHGPVRDAVLGFLRECAPARGRADHWLLHPGGRVVLESFQSAFELAEADLRWSRESLARIGNLSSASVLFILGDLLASGKARAGETALMAALGPAFAAEMVWMEW